MISNNMLEHIRKSIEEGELFAAHVPVVKQLLESFDEQAMEIARLKAKLQAADANMDVLEQSYYQQAKTIDKLNAQLAATWQPIEAQTMAERRTINCACIDGCRDTAIVYPSQEPKPKG